MAHHPAVAAALESVRHTRPRHARHRPDASKCFPLDGGDFNKVLVEVWECGAIGCKWQSDSAPAEMPHVQVLDCAEGYTIVFTHSRGDMFRVDVEYAHAVWAAACARFRWWRAEG